MQAMLSLNPATPQKSRLDYKLARFPFSEYELIDMDSCLENRTKMVPTVSLSLCPLNSCLQSTASNFQLLQNLSFLIYASQQPIAYS